MSLDMTTKCNIELKLLEICRLCLTEEGNKTSIFEETCDTPLTVKISYCVSVEVAAGDGLPELICQKCTSHVNSWYIFKKECQKSEAYLRDYLSKKLSIAASKNNELDTGGTESAFESKAVTHRNGCGSVLRCTNSETKRKDTTGSKQRRSAGGKGKPRIHHEKGLPESLLDVVLEEGIKEEDCNHGREGYDVDTKEFQTILEEVNVKTKEVDTKHGVNLSAQASSRVYTCSVCQKIFTNKSDLQGHGVIHSGDKKFACKECDKAFFSERKLKLHLKTHSSERPCLCSICGKSFREKSNLKRHFRLHSEDTPFLCNICGKAFKTELYLNRHLVTHSGEKKYTCSECGKAFRCRDTLLVHIKVHALERPLCCSVCGKGFKRKKELIRHTRIHTGEKPFVCVYCGRCFSDNWNLTQHVRLHTGQKPYVCSVCSQAFTHNVTLRKHVKLKHCNSD